MNWVDVSLLGVIALSAILAFFHGLVREALGVAGWVGAAVVALLARKEVQPFLDPYFTPPWLAEAIGAGVVFLVALIVFKLMINAVADRVQDSALGGIDRVLGLVFGAAFVEHFAASREWEEREYRRHISDWELARYFEII